MVRLLLARRGQTMWLVVLMVVSVGAVSAAPWYETVVFSSAAATNVGVEW